MIHDSSGDCHVAAPGRLRLWSSLTALTAMHPLGTVATVHLDFNFDHWLCSASTSTLTHWQVSTMTPSTDGSLCALVRFDIDHQLCILLCFDIDHQLCALVRFDINGAATVNYVSKTFEPSNLCPSAHGINVLFWQGRNLCGISKSRAKVPHPAKASCCLFFSTPTNLCPGTYLESGTRWALALSRILGICSGLSGGAGRKVKILTKRSAALLILEARSEQSKE